MSVKFDSIQHVHFSKHEINLFVVSFNARITCFYRTLYSATQTQTQVQCSKTSRLITTNTLLDKLESNSDLLQKKWVVVEIMTRNAATWVRQIQKHVINSRKGIILYSFTWGETKRIKWILQREVLKQVFWNSMRLLSFSFLHYIY